MRDLFRFLLRIRNTLLFLALMAVSMVLLHNGNQHHRAQAFTTSSALAGTVLGWRAAITDYANLKEVNRRLAEENASWRSRHESAYTPVENLFVRINDTIHRQLYSHITARVVNSTWHKQRNFLTLDKGRTADVEAGMGVVGKDGIVGVVRETSPHFASVISILSPNLRVSVRVRRTGHFGLLYWDTADPRTASVIDIPKHARIVVGDTVETRGGDGTFPAGSPVGIVQEITTPSGSNYLGITVLLSEDLTSSGYVYVVKDLLRAERDTLGTTHSEP